MVICVVLITHCTNQAMGTRNNPQRISENTPPVVSSLRPGIWPRLIRLVTKGFSNRFLPLTPSHLGLQAPLAGATDRVQQSDVLLAPHQFFDRARSRRVIGVKEPF